METQVKQITSVSLAAYNPRVDLKPGDPEYQQLKASLEQFGLVEPLVWNQRSGNLVGGHQRLKVWAALGHQEAPFSVVDLDETQERALNLALNNLRGRWDERKLADLIAELAAQPATLALAGFDQAEVSAFLHKHAGYHAADFLQPLLAGAPAAPLTVPAVTLAAGTAAPAPPAPLETATSYPVSFVVSAEGRDTVWEAVKQAKARFGVATTPEAMVAICAQFLTTGGAR